MTNSKCLPWRLIWPGLLTLVLCGCAERGPQRFELSGKVTYAGKPVPAGRILLTPDREAKNEGPRGVANIENGRFETLPDKGTVGGPHVVMIVGGDGKPVGGTPYGAALFPPYRVTVDIPKSAATMDFDVPHAP